MRVALEHGGVVFGHFIGPVACASCGDREEGPWMMCHGCGAGICEDCDEEVQAAFPLRPWVACVWCAVIATDAPEATDVHP